MDANIHLKLELRKQGKHEEADRSLAEFRAYPEYRMSEAMLEKK